MSNSSKNQNSSLDILSISLFFKSMTFKDCTKLPRKVTIKAEFLFINYSNKSPIYSRSLMLIF